VGGCSTCSWRRLITLGHDLLSCGRHVLHCYLPRTLFLTCPQHPGFSPNSTLPAPTSYTCLGTQQFLFAPLSSIQIQNE
jgi:hypothetical protein